MHFTLIISIVILVLACCIKGRNHVRTRHVRHDDPLLAWTEHGPVYGRYDHGLLQRKNEETNPRAFYGIPFAAPPIKALRFAPPARWNDTWSNATQREGWQTLKARDARHWGPSCPQVYPLALKQSEDCLYLNVFIPPVSRTKNTTEKLPVLVWIFGGAFYFGDGMSMGLYDGRHIVGRTDAIVVTFNHRVGIFGFYASEATGTNFGIQDQRAALEWVQRNIEGFGGDPSRVLVYGISSGAVSVAIQLTSPEFMNAEKPLFHRAAILSGPLGTEMRRMEDLTHATSSVAGKVGCLPQNATEPNLECMRKASVAKLAWLTKVNRNAPGTSREIGDMYTFWPAVDGSVITGQPRDLVRQGKFADVPLFIGDNRNETWSFFIHTGIPVVGRSVYKTLEPASAFSHLTATFGTNVSKVMETYVPDGAKSLEKSKHENVARMVRITSDYAFHCPALLVADVVSRRQPVFKYEFASRSKFLPGYGECRRNASCHGTDVNFYWQNIPITDRRRRQLSDRMMSYLVNFASTGDVNKGPGMDSPLLQGRLPPWPRYNEVTRKQVILAEGEIQVSAPLHQQECRLWVCTPCDVLA